MFAHFMSVSHCNSCSMSIFFHIVTFVIKKVSLIDELLLIDETMIS